MPLLRAIRRMVKLPNNVPKGESFTFVQIADPQFGFKDRYLEKRKPPHNWAAEICWLKRCFEHIDQLEPQPLFVVICGNLVDAETTSPQRDAQVADMKVTLAEWNTNISVIVLPGNRDVDDQMTSHSILQYRDEWGDDYFAFEVAGHRFLCVNSQLWFDASRCNNDEASKQDAWLTKQLAQGHVTCIFQHKPFYTEYFEERSQCFNLPLQARQRLLPKLWAAKVRAVFAGHLHRNNEQHWSPEGNSNQDRYIQLTTVTSVGWQLEPNINPRFIQGKRGFNICRIEPSGDILVQYHEYQ